MQTEVIQQSAVGQAKKPQYKRIDMGFMSMRLPDNMPRFAILPYLSYLSGNCSYILVNPADRLGKVTISDLSKDKIFFDPGEGGGYYLQMNDLYAAREIQIQQIKQKFQGDTWRIQSELMRLGGCPRFFSAEPSSAVPESVRLDVEKGTFKKFFNLKVAWEATWREVEFKSAPLDPILIGQYIDKFYILATWDLTKLESYVVSEFVED